MPSIAGRARRPATPTLRRLLWPSSDKNSFGPSPPSLASRVGRDVSGSFFWTDDVGHQVPLGLQAIASPCRCARRLPPVRPRTSLFECCPMVPTVSPVSSRNTAKNRLELCRTCNILDCMRYFFREPDARLTGILNEWNAPCIPVFSRCNGICGNFQNKCMSGVRINEMLQRKKSSPFLVKN